MAEKKHGAGYAELKKTIDENLIGTAYALFGEERYLLEYCLGEMRKKLVPADFEEFNHRIIEGRGMELNALSEAVDALPVFSERTLIEINDYDMSRLGEADRNGLLDILSDIPEYACVVFVFDTVEFKLDSRVKANAQIKKLLTAVEFCPQEKSDLVNWIARRFRALGKKTDRDTAEYLAFISGGLMTQLVTEIEKTAAVSDSPIVTRAEIDKVVTPVLDAQVYKMTDAVASRKFDEAAGVLADLLSMNEPPHKILFSLSLKLRQLLAARLCLDCGKGAGELMELANIRYDFQARQTLTAAKKLSRSYCVFAVSQASETALRLNRGEDGKSCLTDLLVRLACGGDNG